MYFIYSENFIFGSFYSKSLILIWTMFFKMYKYFKEE